MNGARNRRSGHRWEVTLANELSAALGLEIITARSVGMGRGSDLVTVTGYDARERPVAYAPSVLGWAVECKAVKRRSPASWLRQAHGQAAPGTVPVVLWKRPRKPWREGSAFLVDGGAPRGWCEQTLGEWLDGVMANLSETDKTNKNYGITHERLDELVRISEDAELYDLPPTGQHP